MAQLTPEQQKAIAIATARLRLQQQGTPVPPALQGTRDAQAAAYPSSQEQGRGGAGVDAEPGILQQAMRHVQDFTTGIDKAGGSFIQSGGDWVANTLGMKVPPPRMTPTGRDVFAPDNTAQSVGNVVGKAGLAIGGGMVGGPTVAGGVAAGGMMGALQNPDAPAGPAALGMAAPLVGAVIRALPSASRAAKNFDLVDAKAAKVPINPAAADAIAARSKELSSRGATLPKVLRDYIRERGANPDEITYEVARDFAKNAGRLSSAERQMANPEMKKLTGNFYNALKDANREAAVKVGMGKLYDSAINEFRRASNIADKTAIAWKWTKKIAAATAVGATAGAAINEMIKK